MINKSINIFFTTFFFSVFLFLGCSNSESVNNELNTETDDPSITLRKQLSQTIDFIPWAEPVVFSEVDINWSSFGSKNEELVFLGNPKRVFPSVSELGILDNSGTDKMILTSSTDFFEKLKTGDIDNCFVNSNFDSIKVLLKDRNQNGPFDRYVCANPVLLSDDSFQIDCLFFNKENTLLAHLFLEKDSKEIKFQDFYFEELEKK